MAGDRRVDASEGLTGQTAAPNHDAALLQGTGRGGIVHFASAIEGLAGWKNLAIGHGDLAWSRQRLGDGNLGLPGQPWVLEYRSQTWLSRVAFQFRTKLQHE